jgi:hypothetical protein
MKYTIKVNRGDWDYMRGFLECLGYMGVDNMLFTDAVIRLQDLMTEIDNVQPGCDEPEGEEEASK